jgi:hypothetical protein
MGYSCGPQPMEKDDGVMKNVLMGFTGNSTLGAGYIYAPYVPLQSTPSVNVSSFGGGYATMTLYSPKEKQFAMGVDMFKRGTVVRVSSYTKNKYVVKLQKDLQDANSDGAAFIVRVFDYWKHDYTILTDGEYYQMPLNKPFIQLSLNDQIKIHDRIEAFLEGPQSKYGQLNFNKFVMPVINSPWPSIKGII